MFRTKETNFVYFFCAPYRCINNNRDGRVFAFPFNVDPQDKLDWVSNGTSLILSPEVLTYWNKE